MRVLVETSSSCVLVAVGVFALLRTSAIQRWMLDLHRRSARVSSFNPWLRLIQRPSYLIWLRLVGVLSIGLGIAIGFEAISRVIS